MCNIEKDTGGGGGGGGDSRNSRNSNLKIFFQ